MSTNTFVQVASTIPHIYVPYEFLFGSVDADVATGASKDAAVKFGAVLGVQELITAEQGDTITTFKLKKGHLYKCFADVLYYDSNAQASYYNREYMWYDTKTGQTLGLFGVKDFHESEFDYASPAICVVDASTQDREVAVKVTSEDGYVDSYKRGSKCVIEVITDRSGPFNQG